MELNEDGKARIVLEINNLPGLELYNLEYITVVATDIDFDDYPEISCDYGWSIPFDMDMPHENYSKLSEDLFNGTINFPEAVDAALHSVIKSEILK